jgi:hypothetical protein
MNHGGKSFKASVIALPSPLGKDIEYLNPSMGFTFTCVLNIQTLALLCALQGAKVSKTKLNT